jgi:hypothetical protein
LTGILRFKSCQRCGGDLLEEPGTEQHDLFIRFLSCLQCGELRFEELPRPAINPQLLRGRTGRPPKVRAV